MLENPKIIIFPLNETELSMINQYRKVKDFLLPGNITYHFNEKHKLMSYDFKGTKREKDFTNKENDVNFVENPLK